MEQNQIGNSTTASSPLVTTGDVVYFRGTDDKLWKVNGDGTGLTQIGTNKTNRSSRGASKDGGEGQGSRHGRWLR
jgi:hypothetical protein